MFFKIVVLRNFHKKTPVLESLFNKVGGLQLYEKETPTQVFSWEYCKIFKNISFNRIPLVGDSDSYNQSDKLTRPLYPPPYPQLIIITFLA